MSNLEKEYEYAKNSFQRKKREMNREEEEYKKEMKKEIRSIENENRKILNKQKEEEKKLDDYYKKLEEEKLGNIYKDKYQKDLNLNLTEIKLKSENELQNEKNKNVIKNIEIKNKFLIDIKHQANEHEEDLKKLDLENQIIENDLKIKQKELNLEKKQIIEKNEKKKRK